MLTLTRSGEETFIHRGIFILDNLLCSPPPPPPDNLVITGSTEQDSCQGCHKLINPPGNALNHFDEVGRYRTVDDHGMAIFVEGSFFMGPSFSNALEMIGIVSTDDKLPACVLDQFFGYSISSIPETYNAKARAEMVSSWQQRGYGFRDMLISIVNSPSFQYRRTAPSE